MLNRFGLRTSLNAVFVSVVVLADAVGARELFVNNLTGDDRSDARLPTSTADGGPVRTIGRALHLATAGDHIVVANTGTPYREALSLSAANHSGVSVRPFLIEGNGAVLDGSLPVPTDAWEPVVGELFRFRPPAGGYHQLFLGARPLVKKPVDALEGRLPELAPGEWCSHGGAIYFRAERGKAPRDYDLSYAALPVGITLYHVHDVRIVDLVVQGFRRDGVNAHDGCLDVRLGGLTLRGNGRAGLAVGGSSKVEADGCIIGDNRTTQVNLSGWSALSLQLCELLDAAAPAMTRTGGKLFVDGEAR